MSFKNVFDGLETYVSSTRYTPDDVQVSDPIWGLQGPSISWSQSGASSPWGPLILMPQHGTPEPGQLRRFPGKKSNFKNVFCEITVIHYLFMREETENESGAWQHMWRQRASVSVEVSAVLFA